MVSRFVGSRRAGGPAKSVLVPEVDANLCTSATSPSGFRELLEELKRKPPRCSVEVAQYTAKNWGGRHENEDRYMNFQSVSEEPVRLDFHTVGVLDGHDTEVASDTVARLLPDAVAKRLKAGLPIVEAYTATMAEMEEALKKYHPSAGTCVNSCTIGAGFVWCANLGDCRSALITLEEPATAGAATKAETLHWMSRDHKASCSYERARIIEAGGTVIDGRVEGLEPSRTIGDFDVKLQTKPGVISIKPEVRQFEIGLGAGQTGRHAILVCGTDGVWDCITGQDICKLIQARKALGTFFTPEAAVQAPGPGVQALRDLAEDVVQFAVAKGSRDDCTCLAAFISVLPKE